MSKYWSSDSFISNDKITNINNINDGIIVYTIDKHSNYPRGISKILFGKYPNDNIYNKGVNRTLGKIIITGNSPILFGFNPPTLVAFVIQHRYGCLNSNGINDPKDDRVK